MSDHGLHGLRGPDWQTTPRNSGFSFLAKATSTRRSPLAVGRISDALSYLRGYLGESKVLVSRDNPSCAGWDALWSVCRRAERAAHEVRHATL
jgi:hypothetical protein